MRIHTAFTLVVVLVSAFIVQGQNDGAAPPDAAEVALNGNNGHNNGAPHAPDCGQCPDPMENNDNAAVDELREEMHTLQDEIAELRKRLEENRECAAKVEALEARLAYLLDQRAKVMKDLEEQKLRDEVQTQEMSLNQVDKMAASLRSKFLALRRAQNEIRSRMDATKTSLTSLETMDAEENGSVAGGDGEDKWSDLNADVKKIHDAIINTLNGSHEKVQGWVKDSGLKGHQIVPDSDGDGDGANGALVEEKAEIGQKIEKLILKNLEKTLHKQKLNKKTKELNHLKQIKKEMEAVAAIKKRAEFYALD